MKRYLMLFLILTLFSIGYSLNLDCDIVKNYVTNLSYSYEHYEFSDEVLINALNATSINYFNCTNKWIVILDGDRKYSYEVDGEKIGSFNRSVIYLSPGVHQINVSAEGYSNKTFEINITGFYILHVNLIELQTTSSQNGGTGGPTPNIFYKLDKDSILSYLGNFANELGLNKSEVEYQEKVYSIVPFETKYIRVSVGGGNSLYYYFKNNWNQSVNVTLVVVIPKNITSNLNGVAMVAGYKVVKEDPIVEWNYLVAPGKEVKVGYTIAKNITKVEPLIVLFHGIKLPETTEKSSKNLSNNEFWNKTTTEINESESNQTTKAISPKKNLKINLLFIAIPIVVGAIAFVSILLYKRRKAYNELEEALDKLDTILKTRRRR